MNIGCNSDQIELSRLRDQLRTIQLNLKIQIDTLSARQSELSIIVMKIRKNY